MVAFQVCSTFSERGNFHCNCFFFFATVAETALSQCYKIANDLLHAHNTRALISTLAACVFSFSFFFDGFFILYTPLLHCAVLLQFFFLLLLCSEFFSILLIYLIQLKNLSVRLAICESRRPKLCNNLSKYITPCNTSSFALLDMQTLHLFFSVNLTRAHTPTVLPMLLVSTFLCSSHSLFPSFCQNPF